MNLGGGKHDSPEALEQAVPGAYPDAEWIDIPPYQSISQAVHARRAEYTRPKTVRIKVGTWNVAAANGTENDLGDWFVHSHGGQECPKRPPPAALGSAEGGGKEASTPLDGGAEIDIYAIGLQEIIDVASTSEALRPFTDPAPANRFKNGMEQALPKGYKLVAEQQLMGLLLLVYTSPSICADLKSADSTSVGTGFMGYMGNKGAVATRLVLNEATRLVFINSHLAAGNDKAAIERRNWDVSQVISRVKFAPVEDVLGSSSGSPEGIGAEDVAFWFGDLNYRLEGMPGDDVRRLLMLHTNRLDKESSVNDTSECLSLDSEGRHGADSMCYDPEMSNGSAEIGADRQLATGEQMREEEDPGSLLTTINCLLPHDELRRQQREGKALQDGWKEGDINFLPTYKYDFGKVGVFDSSEKKRCPSWCDRILYRSWRQRIAYESNIKTEEAARRRDEEMRFQGLDDEVEDEQILFDYNPDTDGDEYNLEDDSENAAANDYPPAVETTASGLDDDIVLERYTSHQGVVSSDHKPLTSIFKLNYEAVVPELKARVYNEVARALDRAENENRPSITMIIDRQNSTGRGSVTEPVHNLANQDEGEEWNSESDPQTLDFGNATYSQPQTRTITIANTGRVSANVGFVDRPAGERQDPGPSPKWLQIHFDKLDEDHASVGMHSIDPGDTCSVIITLFIDDLDILRELNEGVMTLSDVLVLRVQNGRDHFLPVHGAWMPSSFGESIDDLIRIPEGGIRKFRYQCPKFPTPGAEHEVKWSAPRELFKLSEAVEDLVERVLAEWGMTHSKVATPPWEVNASWPFSSESWTSTDEARAELFAPVHEALACDTPLDHCFSSPSEPPSLLRLEVFSSALILFLRNLRDGVIPTKLWETLEESIRSRERGKKLAPDEEKIAILEVLATEPSHSVSFILVTSMLTRTITEICAFAKQKSGAVAQPDRNPDNQTTKSTVTAPDRSRIEEEFARVFTRILVRLPTNAKEKSTKASEARAFRVTRLFIGDEPAGA
ncbi:Endonuclease/exonuclease/phosphatase [Lineolata rhizophorae]|uniref:Endonuclease/exonuclease/phosphatase n=1 Tax=Lineolata rhizophorae TaxID=578093 RepID=A0A6A6NZP5_9PEZI|nr:Endonuclease/exonuclease/phosphatase [Lineolata rhizophorae]